MSVTDTTSGLSLKDILANSSKTVTNTSSDGLAAATKSTTGKNELGKDAFLQLLVTQLKNQNPLDPQDNSAFVAQLAQFSSLEGITTLNSTVSSLAGNYNSSQALQASSLVGRNVIVQTNSVQLDDPSKGMTGSVTVPSSIAGGTVSITDSSGTVVRTIDLGSRAAGSASFTWDGKDKDGKDKDGKDIQFAWRFGVIDSDAVNAYATPGGFVFVTVGLLRQLKSESELAGVLGLIPEAAPAGAENAIGGISDADMEKGQMRCDVNISVRPKGQAELGTKIELKNLNTISGVRRSLWTWRRRRWKKLAGLVQLATMMFISAASCKKRSGRAFECSGPCPS